MYGSSSFSQVPFASLPNRAPINFEISGTAGGAADCNAATEIIQHKTLIAHGSLGNRSTLKLRHGNFLTVTRISDNRIEATIVQGGRTRTGFIEDPNGIESYELVETMG